MLMQLVILIAPELVVAFIIEIVITVLRRTKWGRQFLDVYANTLLNDNVTNERINLCNKLLALIGDSFGCFIISLDLDNYIKYNMIGHFTGKGLLLEEEEFASIHVAYMEQLTRNIEPEQNIQQLLQDITNLHIEINEDINVDLLTIDTSGIDSPIELFPGKRVELRELCRALLPTPDLNKIYHSLEDCINNVYIPKKLMKETEKFHDYLLDILLSKTMGITNREENRFFHGKQGEQIDYVFDDLYNELIKNQTELEREYLELKNEIRKFLKINKR